MNVLFYGSASSFLLYVKWFVRQNQIWFMHICKKSSFSNQRWDPTLGFSIQDFLKFLLEVTFVLPLMKGCIIYHQLGFQRQVCFTLLKLCEVVPQFDLISAQEDIIWRVYLPQGDHLLARTLYSLFFQRGFSVLWEGILITREFATFSAFSEDIPYFLMFATRIHGVDIPW